MYNLPQLPYDYSSLEPYISSAIMELHHKKHHRTYVDKLNAAIKDLPYFSSMPIERLLRHLSDIPAQQQLAVRNHGGGHYNHSLFWQVMSPNGGGQPEGDLAVAINQKYGSFEAFCREFSLAANSLFGSGWVWLMPDMSILTSQNQDNPLMSGGDEPLMGLDVWEHAYYLDYRNLRQDYVSAWWNLVDWDFVARRYQGK